MVPLEFSPGNWFIVIIDAKVFNKFVVHATNSQHHFPLDSRSMTCASLWNGLPLGSGMLTGFWEYIVAAAILVRNLTPSCANNYLSPHKHLFRQAPNISYLHIFGCLTYQHITQLWQKLDPMSEQLMFSGYKGSTQGYKLWNPKTHKFIISTDVTFEETVFPLHTQTPNPS